MKVNLTQQRLKEALNYDPETGLFTWHKPTCRRMLAGDVAGSLNNNGYILIRFDGVTHCAHRLAWLYMTGLLPSKQVDHINRNKSDNRWVNLREASNSENQINTANRNSGSGIRHVRITESKKYQVRLRVNGTEIDFGTHEDIEFAALVAQAAREKHHGVFANHSGEIAE